MFDSAFLVGDGIWEGIRLHRGRFAFLEHHLDRLFQAASATRINPGLSRQEIVDAAKDLVTRLATEGVKAEEMARHGSGGLNAGLNSHTIGSPPIAALGPEWMKRKVIE